MRPASYGALASVIAFAIIGFVTIIGAIYS